MHAGCGGGEVDLYVPKNFRVMGLDFSSEALASYRDLHPNSITVLGDILKLSELGIRERFDGIYNLGVMEHFSRDENIQILSNFNKFLKPGGKIILFWPPSFGLSTIFLDTLQLVMKFLQGSKFRALVPDEPNRYKRKRSLKRDLETCGFKLIRNTFTYRDLFTFITVVAVKNAQH
jgi:2-polyprenyl-3-methyl-5-hydroxy-6-metoxy-1,4-benzoquinol methylase